MEIWIPRRPTGWLAVPFGAPPLALVSAFRYAGHDVPFLQLSLPTGSKSHRIVAASTRDVTRGTTFPNRWQA
jgi:hypothetical protein